MFNNYLCLSDINDCIPDPCENGATCGDEVNDYTCTCMVGYNGKNCSQSKLDHSSPHSTGKKRRIFFYREAPHFTCPKLDAQ